MATIKLLPRKEFEITLDNGNIIAGQYGTWALKRFCDKQKLSLGELQVKKAEDYTMGDVMDLILCAVEQKARQDKAPFSWTDVDCGSWIDQIGGIFSPEITKLFNHQASDVSTEGEEKKTEVLVGQISSEPSTLPA